MAGAEIAIRLLGPVELRRGGVPLAAGGPTQRAVLAMLALHAGEPIPADALADGIWGEGDQPGGGKGIQSHVSRLRTLLRGGRRQPLASVPGGYRLERDGLRIDAFDFERALVEGRQQLAAGDAAAAAETFEAALGLWRGPALMDVRDFPFAAHRALRYDELRVDAAEERLAARLALGEHRALVPELQALVAEHPYRERLHAQLMTALYRAGQQAAALDAYAAARSRLVLDLGVEPGPELAQLQQQVLAQDPALAAPTGTAVDSGPSTLARPRPPPRLPPAPVLFGREILLAQLEEMAASERLITLTGAGGSGKTVLALALAHRLADRYPEAYFVDLAALSRPAQVLPAVAAALGLAPRGGPLATRLAETLAERQMVVVLDNCEHLLDAVPDLAPLVDASAGLFVATSRAPLGLKAERRVAVSPLPVPDADERDLADQPAVALFLRAATNTGAALDLDELPTVGAICRAVDGLPLAIELVAAQTPVEAVAELAVTLADRLPALHARPRDVPERQRTMEATIDWSLARLDAESRRAFGRLAVFAGGFDARGAAAVLERDRPSTIGLLAALLDASLLVRQPPASGQARFRMLEPLRAVAVAGADRSQLEEGKRRHADFMAAEVDRLCPAATGIQRPEDLAQLRLEHANLMAALEYLVQADPGRGVAMAKSLLEYWSWTGSEAALGAVAERLLAVAHRLSAVRRAEASALAALAAETMGDLDPGWRHLDRALQLAAHVDDEGAMALISLTEASVAGDSGDVERAKRACRDALSHAERSGDARLLALALSAWGTFGEQGLGYEKRLQQAARNARAKSMAMSEVVLLRALSGIYLYVNTNPALAGKTCRSALEIATRFGAPEFAAHLANNVGSNALREGSIEEGRLLLLSALRTMDRIDHRFSALYPLSGLGEVEFLAGNWENALIVFSAANALIRTMGYLGAFHPDDIETEASYIRTAEEHLGGAAADARARGERMTYREAVDFAYEINGISGRART